MELSRHFPTMNWLWRHRVALVIAVLAVLFSGVALYKGNEVVYLYRANKVLDAFLRSPQQPIADSALLRAYCTQLESNANGAQSRICSSGDVFHPYLLVGVSEIPAADRVAPTNLMFEAVVPRGWRTEPLHFVVVKRYDSEGNLMRVSQVPNETFPAGVNVLLARNASPDLRLNYSCAVPFLSCKNFADYVTVHWNVSYLME